MNQVAEFAAQFGPGAILGLILLSIVLRPLRSRRARIAFIVVGSAILFESTVAATYFRKRAAESEISACETQARSEERNYRYDCSNMNQIVISPISSIVSATGVIVFGLLIARAMRRSDKSAVE